MGQIGFESNSLIIRYRLRFKMAGTEILIIAVVCRALLGFALRTAGVLSIRLVNLLQKVVVLYGSVFEPRSGEAVLHQHAGLNARRQSGAKQQQNCCHAK